MADSSISHGRHTRSNSYQHHAHAHAHSENRNPNTSEYTNMDMNMDMDGADLAEYLNTPAPAQSQSQSLSATAPASVGKGQSNGHGHGHGTRSGFTHMRPSRPMPKPRGGDRENDEDEKEENLERESESEGSESEGSESEASEKEVEGWYDSETGEFIPASEFVDHDGEFVLQEMPEEMQRELLQQYEDEFENEEEEEGENQLNSNAQLHFTRYERQYLESPEYVRAERQRQSPRERERERERDVSRSTTSAGSKRGGRKGKIVKKKNAKNNNNKADWVTNVNSKSPQTAKKKKKKKRRKKKNGLGKFEELSPNSKITRQFTADPEDLECHLEELQHEVEELQDKYDLLQAKLSATQAMYEEGKSALEANMGAITLAGCQDIDGTGGGTFKRPKDYMKTKDLLAIDERLLELEILDKELRPSLHSARAEQRAATARCREAQMQLDNAQKKIQFLPSADAYTADMLEGEVAALTEQRRQTETEIQAMTELMQKDLRHLRQPLYDLTDEVENMEDQISDCIREKRLYERQRSTIEGKMDVLTRKKNEWLAELRGYGEAAADEMLMIVFAQYDADESGQMDANEVFLALQDIRLPSDPPITTEAVMQYIRETDTDGNGLISFHEFAAAFRSMLLS